MIVERLLRLAAIVVALFGAIDPAFTARGRPRVAVLAGDPSADGLARDVQQALAPSFDVTAAPDPAAPAWVLTATGAAHAADTVWPSGTIVSVVLPAASRSVTIERVARPASAHPDSRAMVTAAVHARGLERTDSTLVLRSGGLELGRETIRWTKPDERVEVGFGTRLPQRGANHITLDVVDAPATARADFTIVASEARTPVLVFEARPSWAATFVRRALERDPRFDVEARIRVATGITSGRNVDVARAPLDGYALLVVGGADALSAPEVEGIARFARGRGGSVLFVLDRAPSGPVLAIVPASGFEVRTLGAPATLPLGRGERLEAREWALARGVGPAATTIDAVSGTTPIGAGLVRVPAGAGRLVFVGALDAWRYRGADDRPTERAWADLANRLSAEVAPALSVHLDRDVVGPGEPVVARAELADAGDEVRVRARLETGGGGGLATVRLWPDEGRSRFSGRLNAPSQEGVYAVSVAADTGSPAVVRVPLIVAAGARAPQPPPDGLRALVESRDGVVVHAGEIARLSEHLQRRLAGRESQASRRPMHSRWWLAVFTACLGGEWWLRRRHGRR